MAPFTAAFGLTGRLPSAVSSPAASSPVLTSPAALSLRELRAACPVPERRSSAPEWIPPIPLAITSAVPTCWRRAVLGT